MFLFFEFFMLFFKTKKLWWAKKSIGASNEIIEIDGIILVGGVVGCLLSLNGFFLAITT